MKVVVLGDEGVGKRSLINSLFQPAYSKKRVILDTHWKSTGFLTTNYQKKIGSYPINFQIWILNPLIIKRTGKSLYHGKPSNKTVGEVYCYGALGAVVVYDVTNQRSINNIQKWIKLVWENNGRGVIPLTIIANKIDLDENNFKAREKGTQLAEKFTEQTQAEGFKVIFKELSINNRIQVIKKVFQELGQAYIDLINFHRKKGQTES